MFVIPESEKEFIGTENSIYGFPTKNGMSILVDTIVKIKKEQSIGKIEGIDLGCGDGKLIDFFNKKLKKSVWTGIEISSSRIEMSKYKDDNVIIEGNMLDLNLSLYNMIYVNNICFDDVLNFRLEHKIYNEFSGVLITTRDFTLKKLIDKSFVLYNCGVETNWSKSHRFVFYFVP